LGPGRLPGTQIPEKRFQTLMVRVIPRFARNDGLIADHNESMVRVADLAKASI
jgi:hypothetical protein